MKKWNKFLAGLVLLLAAPCFAASDRFGNERFEVPRTSFTMSTDVNVTIATVVVENVQFTTATPNSGGDLILRGLVFSGVIPSTITFYDDIEYDGLTSTRAIVHYLPINGEGKPVEVDLDVYFSSGLMYNKIGTTPTLIKWDWLSPRRTGDDRK